MFGTYGVDSSHIKLKFTGEDVFLGLDISIPCGLIINELISNTLKHAFPNGNEGEIRIVFQSDANGKFTLIVSDNGIGMPKGLDFNNTRTLGLQLVNTLVNQLDGTIELDGREGVSFRISFPSEQ
jgi:two-component sensor histidine kinase